MSTPRPTDDGPVGDPERAASLLALGAATLGETGGRPLRARIRPIWPGATVAAPAFTAACTGGDNLAIHVAMATAPVGSVLVASAEGISELGYWGEVLTTGAEARGLVGLVIDASVRDVDALAAHGFPVFATGIALPGATKEQPGAIGGPVTVGDVEVRTGDWIVGDTDGVVCIPAADLDQVLAAGRARAAREQELFAALRAGAVTIDLLGLDADRIRDDRR